MRLVLVTLGLMILWCGPGCGDNPDLAAEETFDTIPLDEVTLDRRLVFMDVEGSPTPAEAGAYRVAVAGEGVLRLTPESGSKIELAAQATFHLEEVSEPLALVDRAEDGEVHLLLLLPDGVALDAVGSENQVSTRALVRRRIMPYRITLARRTRPALRFPRTRPATRRYQVTRPKAPTNLVRVGSGSLSLGEPRNYAAFLWNDNSSDETAFVIERSYNFGPFERIGQTPANVTYFEDETVDWAAGPWKWRVRAKSNAHAAYSYPAVYETNILPEPRHNSVGAVEVKVEDIRDACKARGGVWIPIVEHCSTKAGAAVDWFKTAVNPLYAAYKAYFLAIGSGVTLHRLPSYVVIRLRPYFGGTMLEELRFGASHHTSSDSTAVTDALTIYFPAGSGMVKLINSSDERLFQLSSNGGFLHEGEVRWLLHELVHARQSIDWGGRHNYAIRWFGELSGTVIEKLVTDPGNVSTKTLHDAMPMEGRADDDAKKILKSLLD